MGLAFQKQLLRLTRNSLLLPGRAKAIPSVLSQGYIGSPARCQNIVCRDLGHPGSPQSSMLVHCTGDSVLMQSYAYTRHLQAGHWDINPHKTLGATYLSEISGAVSVVRNMLKYPLAPSARKRGPAFGWVWGPSM